MRLTSCWRWNVKVSEAVHATNSKMAMVLDAIQIRGIGKTQPSFRAEVMTRIGGGPSPYLPWIYSTFPKGVPSGPNQVPTGRSVGDYESDAPSLLPISLSGEPNRAGPKDLWDLHRLAVGVAVENVCILSGS